jgi:hypothetical protein
LQQKWAKCIELLELLEQQMFTVNMVQQLMFRVTCTEQRVSQRLVCLTGNGAYCYIYVSIHMNRITQYKIANTHNIYTSQHNQHCNIQLNVK